MAPQFLFFVTGDDEFRIELRVKEIISSSGITAKELLNEDISIDELDNRLSSVDMFASQKVYLLRNPSVLFSTLTDPEITRLSSLLDGIANGPNVVVIYTQGKTVDGRKKVPALLKKKSKYDSISSFKDWEADKLHAWIIHYAKGMGVSLSTEVAQVLEQACGMNLRLIIQELDKLKSYIGDKSVIQLEDAKAVLSSGQGSVYDLTQFMQRQDLKNAVKTLVLMHENGEDPVRLFGLLISTTRLYYQVLALKKSGQSPEQIGKVLGKHPFFIKQLSAQISSSYSLDDLKEAIRQLAHYDLALKTGQVKPHFAVELGLMAVLS